MPYASYSYCQQIPIEFYGVNMYLSSTEFWEKKTSNEDGKRGNTHNWTYPALSFKT